MFVVRLITARRRGANTGEQARKDVTGRGAALLPVRRSWPPGTPSVAIRRRRDRGAAGKHHGHSTARSPGARIDSAGGAP